MTESLRILILEDNPTDAELVQFELREAGLVFTAKVVKTEEDFVLELQTFSPDLILSDYDLPQYNGAMALAEARKRCPDTPFILVTGAVSEDRAIEILTQGAKDYVLKSRLQQRLAPAVRRVIAEAREQKARKKAEEELREAHRTLEGKIEERTAELKKQIEHRDRIEASLLKHNEQLEILSYTAGQLLGSDKPQQLVEKLCSKVMNFLDCDVFFNFVVDDSAGRLHLNACAGIPPETAREIEWLSFGVAVCGCVAQGGVRIVAKNIPTTPDVRTELIKSFGIKAYACHPLMDQNQVIGTLSFGTRTRTNFSDDDLTMMKTVADQVAIAMVRVRSEEKLKAITERFEMAQQAAEVGTWDWNVVTGRIEWSNQMFNLFGLDPQETSASFESWKSIIHPQDAEISSLRIEEALRQKTILNSDYRIVRPNGEIRWINSVGESRYDDQGQPIRMIGICTDITGSKKAEEALRESESREKANAAEMQAIMDLAPVAIWIAHDPLCLRITGNTYADEIMNVSRKSNISASALPGEAAATYKVFQKGKELKAEELPAQMAASTGLPVKAEMMDLVFSDGRIVTMIEGSMPLFDAEGRVRGSVTAGSDLTRLLHTEESLRESEERYRELVQTSPEAVIVHLDGQFLYANPAALRLYGAQSLDQLQSKTVLDLIPEDERAGIALRMKQGTAGERLSLKETKLMRLDGQVIEVESVGGAVTYNGKSAVQIIIRDISKRKNAEEALREKERFLRETQKVARLGGWKANPESNFLMWTEGVYHIVEAPLDYQPDLSEGLKFYVAKYRPVIRERLLQTLTTNEPFAEECELITMSGSHIWVEVRGLSSESEGAATYVVGTIQDISDRKIRENERERYNRTLHALSRSSQVMMRATDEHAYMEEICKIIIEDCGYTMVWIGFAEDDKDKTVRPIAYSGFEEGYIDTLKITWADTERGRGPTGTAIRTGKPTTCRNMLTDPQFEPWKKEAIKRGYASSIVLPLMSGGKAFGALTIYSKEPDSFTKNEENLLVELANDLSYGISAIRLREALKESEQRFHVIATNTPDHIMVQDSDLRYQLVINPQLGLTETDMLGKTDYDILDIRDADKVTAIKRKVLETGNPASLESSLRNSRGETEYFEGAYVPRVGTDGRTDGIIGYFRNTTERKKTEEAILRAKDEWERTFDTVPDMIAILDKEHKVVRVNKAMAQRLRLKPDQCIGVKCYEAVHGLSRPPEFCPHTLTCRDGGEHMAEVHEAILGGDFMVSTTPLCDSEGQLVGSVHVARDITRRKAAEDQLEKQAAQLQERKAQLEEINSELESFSYSISHDLRAPLRAIDGFSRIILRQQGDKFDEKTRHQFDMIRNNIGLMGVLIENILSFSRVQKTSMNISLIDMDKLAREVWNEIKTANKEQKIEFKIKKLKPAYGDLNLIKQVLVNLLSNAVKFTKNKKQGIIDMSSCIDDGKIVYSVKDNGAGFDMANYDKLFGVFQRLHSSEEYEGTGIGLAIVQRIINRHGGRVWAESKVGKGATFCFTLDSSPLDDSPQRRRKKKNK